ncbi:MAG: hypothetical protein QOD26_4199 [Betaproteobacteria bacterium]|jgi:diguanylate cyclase (GGDEF)-like protein/PAS domain S-box-containing protein|nr:hypothetical protein [Betaproteobacteria bacterium]
MKPIKTLLLEDATEELSALIETLHKTGQRLEELTAGEVDAVAGRDGRAFLLGRAQEQLRHIESAKQAAILNALPAHIALVDTEGVVLSVNDGWRQFGRTNAVQCAGHEVGVNYLDLCSSALGEDAGDAHRAAEGLRAVLAGTVKSFSIEFSCHSPAQPRWFVMTVSPLAGERPNGAVIMHLDITQRRRTQAALARSEEGLHRAQVMAKLAHVITAADGSFEQWSETLPGMVGVEPAALPRTTRAWLELLHPDDRARFRATAIEASVRKVHVELEYRLQRADGEWIHLRQTMEPLRAEQKTADRLRWFNTLQDITAERLAHESLLASELRFRQMADSISDVFFLQNLDSSQIYYVSPAYERIWGRSRDSLYADPASWSQAIHPDDLQHAFAKVTAGRHTGFDHEFRIVRPDGELRWIHVRGFAIPDEAGRPYRTAGIASDITERKDASDALWESERRFSDLLGNIEMVSLMLDTKARITYCNDYLLRLTGWRREEVMGRDWFELFIPPEAGDMREAHARLISARLEALHHENEILTRSGERRLIRWNNSVLWSAAGEVVGSASIGEDITEQKRAEIRIKGLNRVYAVLSGINTLIVRVRSREELFREACRIAVEHGGFRMAWIGVVDAAAGAIRPLASAGEVGDFFASAPLAITETKAGSHGLAGRAVREMKPMVSNDVHNDPQRMMKRELAERGINSLALIPLIVADEAIGVLALYAAEIGAFDQDEVRLLLELAGDIAFAVQHLEKAEKLERMTRVNAMLSGINGAIGRIRDRQGLFEEACRIAVETGGLPFAWFGVVDDAGMRLLPVASAGTDGGFLEMIRDRLSLRDDAPAGHGLAARAVRERRATVLHDVDAQVYPKYQALYAERGIKTVAALPLLVAGRAVGAFGLLATEAGFFDEDEMKLLGEVAGNIAFALEHLEKEEKVRRLTRVRTVLSDINALIVRVSERDELFSEACRIAAESGQFPFAMVAIADPPAHRLRAVAWAGDKDGFVQAMQPIGDAKEVKPGLGAMAMAKGVPVICNDIQADGSSLRFSKEALERGYRSVAALPLVVAGKAIGALVLYAAEVGFFDDAEMRMLLDLAADISFAVDHIEKEHKLDESEARFRQMADNIRDVFFLRDADRARMLYVSPAYEEIWGRSRESLYSDPASWAQAIHPDDRAATAARSKPGALSGTYEVEFRIVRPDGSIRWIETKGFAVREASGESARIAGVAKDITQRKLADLALRESERRFGDVLGNVQMVSMMLDTKACITYCNDYLLRLTGWQREELIGRNWFEVFIPSDLGDLTEVHAALVADRPGALHHENEILTRAGERRLIRWNNSVLRSAAGEVVGTASIGEDITEQKLAEVQIERLNRVYAVLSGINSLIVRVGDRDELFREACRVAVEHGKFAMSWIGTFDPATQDVTPVAWAGEAAHELTRAKSSARDDTPRGTGAVGQSIRERRPVFNNNILTQSFGGPRLQEILRLGFQSHITLPLYEDQAVVATLTMYTRERDYFDDEEVRLLTELAGDISFALQNISRQQKLDKLARIRAVSSEINAAIIRIRERKALLEQACRIVAEHGKFGMVWIGTLDHDAQQVQPVAWKGFSEETAHAVTWAGIGSANGTLSEAIRTRKASVRNDIESELPGGKLRGEAMKQGCCSSVCLPLVVDDRVAALLVLFATERGFFDQDELALLDEVAADISFALQAIEKQNKLDYLSYYDVLTGLANRGLFLERVAQYTRSATAGGHKLALFLLDLERFKSINDSLGRPAGDALLKQVAEWLTRNLGDANLLARIGADHFAVVLPQVKPDGNVAGLLEKTLAAFMEHPFRLNDAVFRVAFKIGVAIFPEDGADADTLFKNAEAALKKAKTRGDRYLFYKHQMTETVAGKLTLENQLRQALDKEEFVLHYQPKVNLLSGKLTSTEALIRWNDPRSGLVPPGRFIPILEETGLIHAVGRWALHKAVADYLRWRAAGLKAVRIAVNVSALQLRSRGFVAEVQQAIGVHANAAAGLELEITESLIMEDVKHNIASLQAIRALGVTIAIDDFGTGFSSLAYLSKLPVDTLKIDRSFVVDMTAGPDGLSLVSTIISLAHSLKLKVVAEGVETEEQSRLLRLLNCDEMQGYLFSKPVPTEIFEEKFLVPIAA